MRTPRYGLMCLALFLVACAGSGCNTGIIRTSPVVTTRTLPTASTESSAIFSNMDVKDNVLWHAADGWTNGNPFGVGWRADHVEFLRGNLMLRLDDQPCITDPAQCTGQPYASGEYRTNRFYGYGCVESRLQVPNNSGIVTSLFIYTGPSDGNQHDEIDIEFLGKDTTRMQANYYTAGVGSHEVLIDLGFDASKDFHRYGFRWSPTSIQWYVDGRVVHTEDGSRGMLPAVPGRIMVNLWSGVGVENWLGPFVYSDSPINAYYDWIRFTPLECDPF